jgi:hypothetical protein
MTSDSHLPIPPITPVQVSLILLDVTTVSVDVSLQRIESALVACQITGDATCCPLIATSKRGVQLIPISGNVTTKAVQLGVIVAEITVIVAQVLALIISILVAAVVLSEE